MVQCAIVYYVLFIVSCRNSDSDEKKPISAGMENVLDSHLLQ